MPVYNITVPDSSPLIVYSSGSWRDSHRNDPEWFRYVNGTFHATPDDNALASITFNGSAIYAFGAKRPNHGEYWATLDGNTRIANGFSAQDSFNATLFSQDGLGSQQHQLALQNKWTGPQTWLDVDYAVLTVGDGDPSTVSSDVTLDDWDVNITYSGDWLTSPDGLEGLNYNQTIHRTDVFGARASIIFYGNAIFLYGSTASDHGLFSITLDGIPVPYLFNGSAEVDSPRRQNLLYYSGGLSADVHNLTVTNADVNTPALWFDLDKVVVSTWPVERTTSAATPGVSTSSENRSKQGLSPGIITVVALAVVTVVLLCSLLCFLMWRRQRQHDGHASEMRRIRTATPMRQAQFTIEPFPLESQSSDLSNVQRGAAHPPLISRTMSVRRIPQASMNLLNGSIIMTAAPKPIRAAGVTASPHRDLPPPGYEEATTPARLQRC